jgi:hypothetical protein
MIDAPDITRHQNCVLFYSIIWTMVYYEEHIMQDIRLDLRTLRRTDTTRRDSSEASIYICDDTLMVENIWSIMIEEGAFARGGNEQYTRRIGFQ